MIRISSHRLPFSLSIGGGVVPPEPPPPAPIESAAGVSQWWPKVRQPQELRAVGVAPLQLGVLGQAWLSSVAAGVSGLGVRVAGRGVVEMTVRGHAGAALGSLGRAQFIAGDDDDELMILGLDEEASE